jgi:F420-dependent oxidoreductase-like protein
MTAMTARAISNLSAGRFLLGLGVSGPQVVEGLHSVRYNQPLTRLKENVEIIRQTFSGAKVAYQGKHYQIPLDDSEGKSIRVQKPIYPIPIYLATISPRALEYTGRVADGWLGASFSPDYSDAHFEYIRRGAEVAGRKFEDIEIHVPCSIAIDDDWTASIEKRRSEVAFSLGAMGSKKTNFYNDAYARAGFGEEASHVQSHWIQGRYEEAVSNVTDAMVTKFSAIGDKREVQARLQSYKNAGVDVLVLRFLTDDNSSRVTILEQVLEMTSDLV